MHTHTFQYRLHEGWSVQSFPSCSSEHTLVLLFGAPELQDAPELFKELIEAYPHATYIGCSTSGEIFGTDVHDQSLSVAVVSFEHTQIRSVYLPINDMADSHSVGKELASRLQDEALKGVFILSDGLAVNGSQLVEGINTVLPSNVIVTGGLAGDGDRFQKTWILKEGLPCTGYISAIGLYGSRIQIGHGSKGGWDIFGPERRVTRSESNVLYELDGKPALALYKTYLGERAKDLPASGLLFPIALRNDKATEKHLVRTILSVNEEDQSLTFAGDIPEGSQVQLMKANFERLIQGAEDAAMMTQNRGQNGDNMLAIAISCVGRRLVLGQRIEDEVEATFEEFPKNTQQIGFYSYGEISPYVEKQGTCSLHNQTMTLTTFHES